MAFRHHLIDAFWGCLPAADPVLGHAAQRRVPETPRLTIHWELDRNGHPQSSWALDAHVPRAFPVATQRPM